MSKKRKKSKKSNITAIIVGVIIVLAVAVGVAFALKELKGEGNTNQTQPPVSSDEAEYNKNENVTAEENDRSNSTEKSNEEVEDLTEKQNEADKKPTPSKALGKAPDQDLTDTAKLIVAHYEDYMGVEKGTFYIKTEETIQRNGKYEFILRSNDKEPGKLLADIYVDVRTGRVTDSLGSETWTVNLWY